MKAGTYFVGDLCYVMHPEWNEACELFFKGRNDSGCNEGEFVLKDGRRFANLNTRYGDGSYESSISKDFSVDSGSIGCIAVEDIRDPEFTEASAKKLGDIITFLEEFEVRNDNGTLLFGDIKIYTNYSPFDEEEDEWFEWGELGDEE